jgi:hypothetical protein
MFQKNKKLYEIFENIISFNTYLGYSQNTTIIFFKKFLNQELDYQYCIDSNLFLNTDNEMGKKYSGSLKEFNSE